MKKKLAIGILAFLVVVGVGFLVISNFVTANEEEIVEEVETEVETETGNEKEIAYVNMYTLFENHPQQEEAELEFEGEAERLREELEVRGVDLTSAEREQLLYEYEDYLTDLEQELINEIIVDIDNKIESIATEEEILLVVDHSAVAYGGYNLTDEVLATFENSSTMELETDEEIEFEEEIELEIEE